MGKFMGKFGEFVTSIAAPQYAANQQNMKLAEYSYSKDLEMWNRQNDYNSPIAQMARYEKAGLNPNLVAGQGSPGNATQLPKYNAPTIDYSQKLPMVTNILQTFADLDMKKAGADKTRSEKTGVDLTNDILAIRKQTEEARLWNQLIRDINEADASIVKKEEAVRQAEYDYGIKIDFDHETRKYYVKDIYTPDVPSRAKSKTIAELSKTQNEASLLEEKIQGQRDFNNLFKTDKAINYIMQFLKFVK